MAVDDKWHKSKPKPHEERCKEHNLVPTNEHGIGDRWLVRYRDLDGIQRKRSFAKKTGKNPKIHADAYDAQIKNELSQGTWLDPQKSKTLLSEVIREWKDELSGDLNTVTGKKRKAELRIEPRLGSLSLQELKETPRHLKRFMSSLEKEELKDNTIRGYYRVLVEILNFAVSQRYILANPLHDPDFPKSPKKPKKKVTPYTKTTLERIENALDARCKPIVPLGSGLGLRIGEIFGLSPDDITDDGMIHISRQIKLIYPGEGKSGVYVFALPKWKKTRMVPLPNKIRDLIESLPVKPVTLPWNTVTGKPLTVNLCITDHDGRNFNPNVARKHWDFVLRNVGVPKGGLHELRHTYASRLLVHGVDIRELSTYLGHASPGFTLDTYCHLMLGAGDVARRAIDEML